MATSPPVWHQRRDLGTGCSLSEGRGCCRRPGLTPYPCPASPAAKRAQGPLSLAFRPRGEPRNGVSPAVFPGKGGRRGGAAPFAFPRAEDGGAQSAPGLVRPAPARRLRAGRGRRGGEVSGAGASGAGGSRGGPRSGPYPPPGPSGALLPGPPRQAAAALRVASGSPLGYHRGKMVFSEPLSGDPHPALSHGWVPCEGTGGRVVAGRGAGPCG